jgi:peptidoglycan/xylan/chitin deacetylase (PgdA/CDA1 family)
MQFAPVYPLLYRILRSIFPNCLWHGAENNAEIALTFDDGPHPEYTLQLLEVLDRHQVTASFFCLGTLVDRYPQIAAEIVRRGHWIGLHGYQHVSFTSLTTEELRQSLNKTQTAIESACEIEGNRVWDVRPPNGLFTPKILKQLRQWNYRTVMWSVVPEDWIRPGISVVLKRVLSQVKNGALIVLHDGYYGGEDIAKITDDLIPLLKQKGFQFISIGQM